MVIGKYVVLIAGLDEGHCKYFIFILNRNKGTQPQEKYQWIINLMDFSILRTVSKNTEYLPIKDIDFTPLRVKKEKLNETTHQDSNDKTCTRLATLWGTEPTESRCLQTWASEVPSHWYCH